MWLELAVNGSCVYSCLFTVCERTPYFVAFGSSHTPNCAAYIASLSSFVFVPPTTPILKTLSFSFGTGLWTFVQLELAPFFTRLTGVLVFLCLDTAYTRIAFLWSVSARSDLQILEGARVLWTAGAGFVSRESTRLLVFLGRGLFCFVLVFAFRVVCSDSQLWRNSSALHCASNSELHFRQSQKERSEGSWSSAFA